MKKFDLNNLTYESALKILDARIHCETCCVCLSDANNNIKPDDWDEWAKNTERPAKSWGCHAIGAYALDFILKHNEVKENESQPLPKNTPYADTINFMKRRGYKHCYMCGGDLGGNHD